MPEQELTPIGGPISIPTNEEDWNKDTSKFPKAGKYLSEMGMPGWKEVGRTIGFPCTIIEKGDEAGKGGILYAGVSVEAKFKIKEILEAIGLPVAFDKKTGFPTFNPAECAGKQFISVWTEEKDTRRAEDGGTGKSYVKWTSCAPAGAESEEV